MKRKEDLARGDEGFTHIRNPAALGAALAGDHANSIVAQTTGGIEMQEAAAQRTFTSSDRLPVRGLSEHAKESLTAAGFVFGNVLPGQDRIFIECKLPEGWRKQATDHSMWSNLLDPQGRDRAGIFFKGAFYDYDAHISFRSRYVVDSLYCDENGNEVEIQDATHKVYRVIDQARLSVDGSPFVLHNSVVTADPDWSRDRDVAERVDREQEAVRQSVKLWLKEHFPNADDPFAYWDDPVETAEAMVRAAPKN